MDNPNQIDTVYANYGKNIPKYLQYEGGSGGITFLCCVAADVDVKEICEKYNYECGTIYQVDVDGDKYNSSYTIYPTYSKDGPKFVLQPTISFP